MFKIHLLALFVLVGILPVYSQTPPADPAKFDLFLLVGEANMAGRSPIIGKEGKADPRIITLDSANHWVTRGQPIHADMPGAAAGLVFEFGKLVADANPGTTIGLIPCAYRETTALHWQPGTKLYQDAIKQTRIAMQSGRLRGILWHQGESDANYEFSAAVYSARLKIVLEGFRKDLNAPNVPIILGELGEFTFKEKGGPAAFALSINQQIHAVAEALPNIAVVSSQGLADKGDRLHFSAEAIRDFGKRYFEAWQKEVAASY